jgi:hypothetical protein
MKRIIIILAIQSIFILGGLGQTGFKTGNDYRERFTGRFEGVKYYHYRAFQENYYDTTQVVITVEKFTGWTDGTHSNYLDIDHKVGITFDITSYQNSLNWCSSYAPSYSVRGYLFPTIDTTGHLTYPELAACEQGRLSGYINKDSIKLSYGNNSLMEGFDYKIIGARKASGNEFIKSAGDEVNIFPVPVRDYLNITGINGNSRIIISDVTGRIVKSEWLTEHTVDVSSLKEGLYFVTISTEKERITKKFIKE